MDEANVHEDYLLGFNIPLNPSNQNLMVPTRKIDDQNID
jgi:hypothetical protein